MALGIATAGVALLIPSTGARAQPAAETLPAPFLHVRDRPVFVLGTYGLPEGFSPTDAAAMGFTVFRAPLDRAFWDEAAAAGIRV